ncbi:DUF3304 domain-containing protein [Duganella callida]|uniref:DUF3304 domain-containing protein n=1 Tax=Duganella callida TaxID=2561932 RepID=A0A4Y9S287_9BURK|nr:DUF3304 domain-containing protein [Duganella callida]TFW13638.1 DUF3304 domain-containing protein [Duganella callida]
MEHKNAAWAGTVLVGLVLLGVLCACGRGAPSHHSAEQVSLAIVGYNYTSKYIDSFSVNGQGGGNIFVSSPTSGGGIVCCASYRPGSLIKTVHIRWQSGACYFKEQSSLSKQMFDTIYPFYTEQDVPVEVLAANDPQYMEVHFYPDGSIKAAITEKISPPRLSLDERRNDRTRFPPCPNDRKPKD